MTLGALNPTSDDPSAPVLRGADRMLAVVESSPPDWELLFRSAPSLLVVLAPEPEFRIVDASDAYLRAARCQRESTVGRPFFDVFPERLEGPRATGAGSLREALQRLLASGRPDALNSPVFSSEGELRYVIHRVDAMELEVLRSARERDAAVRQLAAAREEVEAFVQSASRDLARPLRAIDAVCRVFSEMHGVFHNGEVRRLLARIGANVNRMETIIDGLLGLSRVGRMPMSRRHVDVSAHARRIAQKISAREVGRVVAVEIAEGMQAWADESLVAIMLENLMSNAWKYTRPRTDARIEVGARTVVGTTVFHVRDNGVGFDMDRAHKLFAPFVRLHEGAGFEGHGIGLSSAKRIVERHGGEIWAEAKPDAGATIHFTLSGGGG